ncbi:MAG: hypothetical protein US53_C0054G0001 [Candidatus Woesebacteria bacterium GW2011_GWA1_37_7]|uniref:DUF2933 domain-containing protein n=2 Tax=Patescibacteria group TaxID=1783273 RepID=A0A1F6VID3_9BACT|nr:MAG: hypothetical protein US53_C0054G0001 [Candidatus Woesebacteria bacterium GW2011_GWA1_37_7]OGI69407.1 MAG: hypothetical protein A2824_03580 [Candidatus Nomurabacteria bacterium RIFCSPHIGHO2_01_FULL_42_16]
MKQNFPPKNSKPISKTIGICIVLLVAAVIAVSVFKVPVKSLLTYGILLACPLLHFFMMRGDGHEH